MKKLTLDKKDPEEKAKDKKKKKSPPKSFLRKKSVAYGPNDKIVLNIDNLGFDKPKRPKKKSKCFMARFWGSLMEAKHEAFRFKYDTLALN